MDPQLPPSPDRLPPDAFGHAVFVIDGSGRIIIASGQTEPIFGCSDEALVGNDIGQLVAWPPIDQQPRPRVVFLMHRDGSQRRAELTQTQLPDENRWVVHLREQRPLPIAEQELFARLAEDQRGIGKFLHDEVGQELMSLRYACHSLHETLRKDDADLPTARQLIVRVNETIKSLQKQLGQTVRVLNPIDHDGEALLLALKTLVRRVATKTSLEIQFYCPEKVLLDDHTASVQLHAVVQDALSVAVERPGVKFVGMSMLREGAWITLTVLDDAPRDSGFAAEETKILARLDHRARLVGALVQPFAEDGQVGYECRFPVSNPARMPAANATGP
jgi:hypothetical protein